MKKNYILALLLSASFTQVNAQIDVLVLGSETNDSWLYDVKLTLDSTNRFASVDTFNMESQSPSLVLLNQYDSILLFTDNSPHDAIKTGDSLAAFIQNGGGVVDLTFSSSSSYTVDGGFSSYRLFPLVSHNGSQSTYNLYSILIPSHPIMYGVSSFTNYKYIYENMVLNPGVEIIAKYDNNQPLVLEKDSIGTNNSRRAFLNFYPVSSRERSDFWDVNTQGGILMANALDWVAKEQIGVGIKENRSIGSLEIFPNPVNSILTINIKEELIIGLKVFAISGQEVPVSLSSFNQLNVSDYNNGVYIIQVETKNGIAVSRFIKN